jgi:hypothetical protein
VTVGHETVMATATFFGGAVPPPTKAQTDGAAVFDVRGEYTWLDALPEQAEAGAVYWVLLQLETPAPCPPATRFIASRLDADLRTMHATHRGAHTAHKGAHTHTHTRTHTASYRHTHTHTYTHIHTHRHMHAYIGI